MPAPDCAVTHHQTLSPTPDHHILNDSRPPSYNPPILEALHSGDSARLGQSLEHRSSSGASAESDYNQDLARRPSRISPLDRRGKAGLERPNDMSSTMSVPTPVTLPRMTFAERPSFNLPSFSLPSLQHSLSTSNVPDMAVPPPPRLPSHSTYPETKHEDSRRKRTFSSFESRFDASRLQSIEGPAGTARTRLPTVSTTPRSPPASVDAYSQGSRKSLSTHPSTTSATNLRLQPILYSDLQRGSSPPHSHHVDVDQRHAGQSSSYDPLPPSRSNTVASPPALHQERSSSSGGPLDRLLSESLSPVRSFTPYSHNDRSSPNTQQPLDGRRMKDSPFPRGPLTDRSRSPAHHNHPDNMYFQPYTGMGEQAGYSLMTVQTASGSVQVPVDMQAASKSADEKRRRNAGASARFRERRKKKEMEASSTIRKLERQIKNISEDSQFYRKERDYFAGIVMQTAGGDRHFPRLPSPRQGRHTPTSPSDVSDRGFDFVQEDPNCRNVRRRTSSFRGSPEPPSANFRSIRVDSCTSHTTTSNSHRYM